MKEDFKLIRITLHMVDRLLKYPNEVIEDLILKVDKYVFLTNFVVLDIEEDINCPPIL